MAPTRAPRQLLIKRSPPWARFAAATDRRATIREPSRPRAKARQRCHADRREVWIRQDVKPGDSSGISRPGAGIAPDFGRPLIPTAREPEIRRIWLWTMIRLEHIRSFVGLLGNAQTGRQNFGHFMNRLSRISEQELSSNHKKIIFLVFFCVLTVAAPLLFDGQGVFVNDEGIYALMARSFAESGSLAIWNGYEELPSAELVPPLYGRPSGPAGAPVSLSVRGAELPVLPAGRVRGFDSTQRGRLRRDDRRLFPDRAGAVPGYGPRA